MKLFNNKYIRHGVLLALALYMILSSALSYAHTIDEVVDFWVTPGERQQEQLILRSMKRELSMIPKWDEKTERDFTFTILKAAQGDYVHWEESARGRLALVLLFNQYPKALWHHTFDAYMYDPIAEEIVKNGIECGDDKKLSPVERILFYLPLVHSENLNSQQLASKKFKELMQEAPFDLQPLISEHYSMALLKKQTIETFGRFPYRNEFFGRNTTADEVHFIKHTPLKP